MEQYNLLFQTEIDMRTGYKLCTNEQFRELCGNKFYNIYHKIICSEIAKNNIISVNGLIRWIDVAGFYPDYKLLFEYSLINGNIEIFLMIYYIVLFCPNDDDDKKYLTYNHINHLMNDIKSIIKTNSLILNELNELPREVVQMMNIQFNIKIVDYIDKINIINDIYTKYNGLYLDYEGNEDDEEDDYDEFEEYFSNILLKYNVNMHQINNEFYKNYGQLYDELSS